MLRFIGFYLSCISFVFGDVEIFKNQNIFYSGKYSKDNIYYYISLMNNSTGDVFRKELKYNSSIYKLKSTERVMSFRARFFLDKPINIDPNIFKEEATLNHLNRKTKFTKVSENQFIGKRPSFLFDIEFKNNVDITSKEFTNDQANFIKSLTGLKYPLKLIVSQDMHSYNRFISRTNFHFAIFEVGKNQYIVELLGRTGLKKEIPDFVQEKMVKDYSQKIEHFRAAFKKIVHY